MADLGARAGIAFVLGQALALNAIHGGNAHNDRLEAQHMAVRRRGGMLPQASVSPAALRATRDLLRRRVHLRRTRAERLTPLQNTPSQDNLPERGQKSAYQANRDGVAERLAEPAVQKSLAVALARSGHSDERLRDVERSLLNAAKQPNRNTLSLLCTVPGLGALWSLGPLAERHESQRFPRVQEVVSSCQLVTCAKASAGKRYGTSGTKIGHAYLQGACSAAAVRFLRAHPAGQQYLRRYTQRRVVAIERRLVDGTPARLETLRYRSHGDGVINTAYIERLNAIFRERLAALTRRGRALARRPLTLQHGMYLIGTVYNVCTPHASLGCGGRATTPAMAARITDHCWSVQELLSYHVPSPRWTPSKHRGRPSHALKHLIERWCGNHG